MTTLFTSIIEGGIPGRFVWRDDLCVAFLTIQPLQPGHTLVVPRKEVDHWIELEPELLVHLTLTAQSIGKAIQAIWNPQKVAMYLVGVEVPHVHIHVSPIWKMKDIRFDLADPNPSVESMDEAAGKIRHELKRMNCAGVAEA
jgi:histidine triad (HIT) family protein